MTDERSEHQRLFFGLPVPEAYHRPLLVVRDGCGLPASARPQTADNLHLTLVFLGAVDRRQRLCALSAAASIALPPFSIELNQIGHWARPQVLWAAPSAIPVGLKALFGTLQQRLLGCGFNAEQRSYQPHLTLARKLRHYAGATTMPAVRWPVTHFCLYRSLSTANGVRYREIARWPLSAGNRSQEDLDGNNAT